MAHLYGGGYYGACAYAQPPTTVAKAAKSKLFTLLFSACSLVAFLRHITLTLSFFDKKAGYFPLVSAQEVARLLPTKRK
jgi:hypothetical protein